MVDIKKAIEAEKNTQEEKKKLEKVIRSAKLSPVSFNSVRQKIRGYLSREKAFEPRYKHQMGEHAQKRHGNRGKPLEVESSGALVPEGATEQDAYEYAKYILKHKPGDPLPTSGALQLSERIFDIGNFETYGDWARDVITKVHLRNLFTSDQGVLTNEDRNNLRKIAKFNDGFDEYTIKLVDPMKESDMNPDALEHEWGISKYGIRPADVSYIGVGSWDLTGAGKWTINIAKNAEKFGFSKRSIFWHEFGHTVGSYIIERFIGKQLPLENNGEYVDRFAEQMVSLNDASAIDKYLSQKSFRKNR